jgi:hypothetical protein
MATHKPSRFWRLCRIYFRRFRIGMWLVILVLLGALLYLNQIGLPDFAKKPLLEKLHARGIDLQFTRLRLQFYRGLIADNVIIGRAGDASSPTLTLKEMQVRLDYAALAKLQVQVSSLLLRQGRLSWPVTASNQPPRALAVENIQTELRFLPGDLWALDHFQARFAGANIQLAGTVTNASVIRDWKIFQARAGQPPDRANAFQQRLGQLADTLEQIHFPSAPELNLEVQCDARDLSGFGARMTLRAPGAQTPWGTFEGGVFSARVIPPVASEPPRAEVILRAASAQTRWATASNLDLTLHIFASANATNFSADLKLNTARVETKWGRASKVRVTAQWLHSSTNAIPLSGRGELKLAEAETIWGNGKGLQLNVSQSTPTDSAIQISPAWDAWTNLAPYALDWECRLDKLQRLGKSQSPELEASGLFCSGQWQAPELRMTRLSASLYDGGIIAGANLNVATRELGFNLSSDFDPQKISAQLAPQVRHWLAQCSWEKPPQLQADGALVLPAWTNQTPDWRAEVPPTVQLQGRFQVGRAAFRGVTVSRVDGHFACSNLFWRLPDVAVVRPEGRLDLVHETDGRTQDFYFHIHSTIDLPALRPLLETNAQTGLDLVGFTQPPLIDGEIRGRWNDFERISAKATVALTNFTVRGQSASRLETALEYTNKMLTCFNPRIERGPQEIMTAGLLAVDFKAMKIFLTNGFGTADPRALTLAIGPKVGAVMELYHFLELPTARVEGVIPMGNERDADLHFDADAKTFECLRFKVPRVSGQIHWVGDRLTLKNVSADFYHGTAAGSAEFIFPTNRAGAELGFDVVVTNADIHLLMNDLDPHTNRLEGLLTGRWTVAQGNTADGRSWQGNGHANLRDGFIWEIPVFGILSPTLDKIAPGLGSSRASEGTANFVMSQGRIHSDDLEIRASGARLEYRGDVDLEGRVDARVEAELLRDTWVVGRMLSLALWPVSKIFEYKITGTLNEPKMEPLYLVPKLILMPLHPFRAMKEFLPAPPDWTQTNTPSIIAP